MHLSQHPDKFPNRQQLTAIQSEIRSVVIVINTPTTQTAPSIVANRIIGICHIFLRFNIMPYKQHPSFIEPQDKTARLWRYMDLSQFLYVLDKGVLFFPSAATLSKADPYEGEPVLAKVNAAKEKGQDERQRLQLESKVFKHLNFFSCWHMNDDESDAMWKIYTKGSNGVAIQTTVNSLEDCFKNTKEDVHIGEIKYIDHANFLIQSDTAFSNSDYMFKRLAFKHEREVRVITCRPDVREEFFDNYNGRLKTAAHGLREDDILLSPQREGVYVDVDVSTLIERVVVSPLSPKWFSDLVESLSKKLSYKFDVISSEMSRPSPLLLD